MDALMMLSSIALRRSRRVGCAEQMIARRAVSERLLSAAASATVLNSSRSFASLDNRHPSHEFRPLSHTSPLRGPPQWIEHGRRTSSLGCDSRGVRVQLGRQNVRYVGNLEYYAPLIAFHSLVQQLPPSLVGKHHAAVASFWSMAVDEEPTSMMNDGVACKWGDYRVGVAHLIESDAFMRTRVARDVDAMVMAGRDCPATLRVRIALLVIDLACCREPPHGFVQTAGMKIPLGVGGCCRLVSARAPGISNIVEMYIADEAGERLRSRAVYEFCNLGLVLVSMVHGLTPEA